MSDSYDRHPHPDYDPTPPAPPTPLIWHLLPLASGILLATYAFTHPLCWRWVSASGAQCLYFHLAFLLGFTAMVYFGDILFKRRYESHRQRQLAGRITGTVLLFLWDIVLVAALW